MIALRYAPAAAAAVAEYEPDTTLRDTEQIPLLAEGGIESLIRREVLPYAPDAWYAPPSAKVGTRSASPATSTSCSLSALWRRFGPTYWHWSAPPLERGTGSTTLRIRRTETSRRNLLPP